MGSSSSSAAASAARATPPPLLLLLLLSVAVSATHRERLLLRPLPHVGKTLAHFHFATHGAALAPLALRQILTKYDAASVHLSFAVGHYAEARYGPPHGGASASANGTFHAPFGARLQVDFRGDEAASGAFAGRWKGVTSELGGIFSASLNQMDETTVVRVPVNGRAAEFGAYAHEEDAKAPSTHFFQATLAREELCTENLTPWLKMLPCRAHAGLGALVDPIKILSGEYTMLSIFVARDRTTGDWRVHQHLTTVQPSGVDAGWTLGALLLDEASSDVSVMAAQVAACPLANESTVATDGDPDAFVDLKLQRNVATDQRWLRAGAAGVQSPTRPQELVSLHRFQTGYGQVHGGLAARLENRHASCAVTVTYNDVAPWYLRLYFHTLQTRLEPLDGGAARRYAAAAATTPSFTFVPAELRGRPNQFRVRVVLPPRSALVLSVQFEKVFVRLSEHPPDANRGFDIPSGVASFTSSPMCEEPFARVVFSEPLLVALPTPDFSMPYNVITLTSTVVAFFAGSMLNTLLRKAPRIQRILADDKKTV